MMKLLISFLLCLSCLFLHAQDNKILLNGTLVNEEDNSPIPHAHIIDKHARNMVVSSLEGKFKKLIGLGDTLVISIIGYDSAVFFLHEMPESNTLEVVIKLYPSSSMLEPIKVYAFKPEHEFKKEVLEMGIVPDPKNHKQINIPKVQFEPDYSSYFNTPQPGSTQIATFGAGVKLKGFPVTTKDKMLFQQVEKRREIINSKYNEQFVSEITGLKDEKLKKFIDWCNMDENFIFDANAYDIAKALLACLEDFKKEDERM